MRDLVLPAGVGISLPATMVLAGLTPTVSAARREIDAGTVRIDGKVVAIQSYDWVRRELLGKALTVGKQPGVRLVDAPTAGEDGDA